MIESKLSFLINRLNIIFFIWKKNPISEYWLVPGAKGGMFESSIVRLIIRGSNRLAKQPCQQRPVRKIEQKSQRQLRHDELKHDRNIVDTRSHQRQVSRLGYQVFVWRKSNARKRRIFSLFLRRRTVVHLHHRIQRYTNRFGRHSSTPFHLSSSFNIFFDLQFSKIHFLH